VVSTVAFEISCKFAWADETVYLMGTEGRASYVWARGVTDSLGLVRVILDPYEVIYSKTHVK